MALRRLDQFNIFLQTSGMGCRQRERKNAVD
jgi:hypothetical protein